MTDTPTFFATPALFRRWLEAHHQTADELIVGFYKKGSGRPSITWPESVDEALCFGWIDGVRRSLDDTAYTIRFTPRRPGSTWSAVNLRKVEALTAQGRMRPAGLAVHRKRDPAKADQYSFENRQVTLAPRYRDRIRANARAWAYFQARPPWYRRTAGWWIMSAKREATRERRLATLIDCSARGRHVPPLVRPAPTRKK